MKNTTKRTTTPNGDVVRIKYDLKVRLNYNIANLLNRTKLNKDQLPIHHCNPEVYPDYLAMNTEPGKYHHTRNTALAFYSFDNTFDRYDGLFNAIYYNDRKQLKYFKKRYANIQFVIAPDYSIFDNIWEYENLYRLFKIRIRLCFEKCLNCELLLPLGNLHYHKVIDVACPDVCISSKGKTFLHAQGAKVNTIQHTFFGFSCSGLYLKLAPLSFPTRSMWHQTRCRSITAGLNNAPSSASAQKDMFDEQKIEIE